MSQNIEVFQLPMSEIPCVSCGQSEQWASIFRRPSHGQMKLIEKATRKAVADDMALDAEDGLVMTLVNEWHVLDLDGQEIPRKSDQMGRVPQDTMSTLIDELQAVTTATRPNDAIGQSVAVMNALKARVGTEEAEMLDQAIGLFRGALGVPEKNVEDQTVY